MGATGPIPVVSGPNTLGTADAERYMGIDDSADSPPRDGAANDEPTTETTTGAPYTRQHRPPRMRQRVVNRIRSDR